MEVQVFGVKKSADTRAALRFFAERRIKCHFVDLNERAASLGELRRFAQKYGVAALIDRESKRFTELGLKSALLSEDRWLEKLTLEPLLLRMPLVRHQQQLSVGPAEETWRARGAAGKQSAELPNNPPSPEPPVATTYENAHLLPQLFPLRPEAGVGQAPPRFRAAVPPPP